MTKNVSYFLASFFSYMFLSQYILGIFFHNSEYYDTTMEKMSNEKYGIYINIVYAVALVISLVLAVVPLFTTNYIIKFYSLVSNSTISNGTISTGTISTGTAGYVILTIYTIVNRIFSYNIFFSNAIVFALLMYTHCMEIKSYEKSLESMIEDNLMDINISTTIKEYTEIKDNYRDTVQSTNYLFATIIVFGVVGSYFALIYIGKEYNNIYSYIDTFCAIAVQIIYIAAICIITDTVGNIKSLVGSSRFISVFLNRSDFASVKGDVYTDYEVKNSPKKSILKESICSSPKLNTSESSKKINSSESSHKKQKPSRSTSIRQLNNSIIIDTIEKMNACDDTNKKIDFIKNIGFRCMVTGTENGINLDWIILYTQLSDPWEMFTVCGFEINNTQLFQQLISMAFGLLGILEISNLIN
jgi:hypothetical protein